MHSMKDGMIKRIKFSSFANAWIKQTKHKIESHKVAVNTEIIEYFSADYEPSIIFLRIFSTELKVKYEMMKANKAKNTVLIK